MRYLSTRGGIAPIPFCEAVMMGLASDGGLLLPASLPDLRDRLDDWRDLSYPELATEVMGAFIDDLPRADLAELVQRSYATFDTPAVAPLVPVDGVWIQECWHGPTQAFKDLALQFLGNLFEYILARDERELNILAATSGDTGSAAIHGVRGKKGIRIFVLHPHGRVSPVQALQMTTVLDDNVHNLAIEGSFDDGQRIIKALFGDLEFKQRYALGAANSVNWGRVLAQIVYYFYGAFRVEATGHPRPSFCVPTGNFGNVFAAWLARRLGAPMGRLLLATNENDILHRFFATGRYELGEVRQTHSPSMDIQVASNFERYLYYRLGEDPVALSAMMARFRDTGSLALPRSEPPEFVSAAGTNAETIATIREVHEAEGYVLDPHTAVGVAVARRLAEPGETVICEATAHPAKFADAVTEAIGHNPAPHPDLEGLADRPTRVRVIPASVEAVREVIEEVLGP